MVSQRCWTQEFEFIYASNNCKHRKGGGKDLDLIVNYYTSSVRLLPQLACFIVDQNLHMIVAYMFSPLAIYLSQGAGTGKWRAEGV